MVRFEGRLLPGAEGKDVPIPVQFRTPLEAQPIDRRYRTSVMAHHTSDNTLTKHAGNCRLFLCIVDDK